MLSKNERQRRLWAAEQKPELVTNDQSLEMFGHKSFDGFRKFLTLNGVDTYTNAKWPNSRFYDRKQIEAVAAQYLEDNPSRRERAEKLMDHSGDIIPDLIETSSITTTPSRKRSDLNTFKKFIPDHKWSKEQFLEYWEGHLNYGATNDILDRAPSIYRMKSYDAFALVRILTNSPVKEYGGIPGYRMDKLIFSRAVKNYAKTSEERKRLMDTVMRLYATTEFCKLPPYEVVAVVYELMFGS
jgi:hypothetical protein